MIIDVNVHVSRWPTRRLPYDELSDLVAKLRANQVEQAWVGSFDALLHKDIASVNDRLTDACTMSQGLLLPFGAINPILPNWQDDIRRCVQVHRMRGIRLHPDYHGYKLDDPRVNELFALCVEHHLILQIAVSMEDERTQHPLLQVAPVDLKPLTDLLANHPKLRIVLLNALRSARGDALAQFIERGNVYVEIATLEGVEGVEKLLKQIPQDRILLGSNFPFFVHEAALFKMQESELGQVQRQAILRDNAKRLLDRE